MSKKNLLSGRDRELQELAENYEAACENNQPFYADADDFADLAIGMLSIIKYNKPMKS